MASLYEIDRSIMECVDMETGEIIDPGKLESLKMERRAKVRINWSVLGFGERRGSV